MFRSVGKDAAARLAESVDRSTAAAQEALQLMRTQSEAMQKSFNEAMEFANERTSQLNKQMQEYTEIVARTSTQSGENQKRTDALSEKLNSLEAELKQIESQMEAVSKAAKTLEETTIEALDSADEIDNKRHQFESMYRQFEITVLTLLDTAADLVDVDIRSESPTSQDFTYLLGNSDSDSNDDESVHGDSFAPVAVLNSNLKW